MEMTQLEFFLQVIAEGSFSKAADAVGRTQPAVSIAIRRLEEEVGAPRRGGARSPCVGAWGRADPDGAVGAARLFGQLGQLLRAQADAVDEHGVARGELRQPRQHACTERVGRDEFFAAQDQ